MHYRIIVTGESKEADLLSSVFLLFNKKIEKLLTCSEVKVVYL